MSWERDAFPSSDQRLLTRLPSLLEGGSGHNTVVESASSRVRCGCVCSVLQWANAGCELGGRLTGRR